MAGDAASFEWPLPAHLLFTSLEVVALPAGYPLLARPWKLEAAYDISPGPLTAARGLLRAVSRLRAGLPLSLAWN